MLPDQTHHLHTEPPEGQTGVTAARVLALVVPDKEQLLMSLAIVHLPSMLVAVVPEHLVALVVLAVLVAVETARLAIVQRVVQLRQILAVVEAERVEAKLLQVAVTLAV